MQTPALLIDGVGRCHMRMLPGKPFDWKVPIQRPYQFFEAPLHEFANERLPVATFERTHEVRNGCVVYRWVRTEGL